MPKVRIEIHLDSKEVKLLDKLAKENGRSRKNICEVEIKKLIEAPKSKWLEPETYRRITK